MAIATAHAAVSAFHRLVISPPEGLDAARRTGAPIDTVLIPMLRAADETVRAWAASALADLPVPEAVEPLKAAYEAVKARGTPLDWSEPEAIRRALIALGQRRRSSRRSSRNERATSSRSAAPGPSPTSSP